MAGHAVPLKTAAPKQISWLINDGAIKQLSSAGATTSLINSAFANDHSYVINNTSAINSVGIPTATYSSYAALQEAFTNHTLPGNYKAVLYDNENWSLTSLTTSSS